MEWLGIFDLDILADRFRRDMHEKIALNNNGEEEEIEEVVQLDYDYQDYVEHFDQIKSFIDKT